MTNGSLIRSKVLQNALRYFWPALGDKWSWKPIVGRFESRRFTQVYCTGVANGAGGPISVLAFLYIHTYESTTLVCVAIWFM